MSNLYISAYGRSNVGKKRGNNEDNFYISGVTVDSALDITAKVKSTDETALAVFDGMGGEAAGERASQATAVTYGQKMSLMLDGDFAPDTVQATIEAANKKVCDETRLLGKRMGCTFVSAGFKNNTIYVSNVGDSRVYLLRNGKLHRVSKDHTVAQSMVDSGVISYEESQRIKEKHKLTQHIGIFPDELILEPYYSNIPAQIGDIVLLCSDGLTDMLTDEDIANILRAGGTEEQLTNALVDTALANGGKDNVTVIVGKVDGDAVVMPVVAPTVASTDGSIDVSPNGNSKFKLFAIIGGAVALVLVAVIVVLFACGKGDSDNDKSKKKEKTTKETSQSHITDVMPGFGNDYTGSDFGTTDTDDENITKPSVADPAQGVQDNGSPDIQNPFEDVQDNDVPDIQKPNQDEQGNGLPGIQNPAQDEQGNGLSGIQNPIQDENVNNNNGGSFNNNDS